MTTVGLVSAVYDGYDTLKPFPPQEGVDVDAVCVTDDPTLECAGWRVIWEPRAGVHPNRAAKRPKMLPWRYTTAARTVWVDASFRILSASFCADLAAMVDPRNPVAQFVHPWRDCIYEEAQASVGLAKYDGEPILEQADWYRSIGHPPHWGLWATGVIARLMTDTTFQFGHRWLADCHVWSYQDQLSEAPALRDQRLRPVPVPGSHLENAWLAYEASGRHG